MFKFVAVAAPLVLGGAYFTGAFDGGYSRTVDRPPAEVIAQLEHLDITRQPGNPGTDPSRSGGIQPLFRHDASDHGIVFTVMSGDKVAVTMTADVTPLDGGKRSRVTAHVARGDAPDDFVSPAFRSTGLTMGLFAMALEDELNELTAPPPGDPAKCAALFDRFQRENEGDADLHEQHDTRDAIGDVAKITVRLGAYEADARRMGCIDTHARAGDDFAPLRSEMQPARSSSFPRAIRPGRPMLDPNPDHR
jgi:hypothetical protein